MSLRRRSRPAPSLESLDDRCLLSGLTPQQITSAYGLNAVTFNVNGQSIHGDGSGQTIAVVVAYHDPYLTSDLNTFDATYHLAGANLSQVNLAGTQTNDGWAGEESLDVEWAHAIAPGAKIVVVEARSSNLSDMLSAVNTARSISGVSVVSMSWGMSEFSGQTAYDSYFTTPAGHNGVTFVSASGDSGTGSGAEWPSSSPNVLAVGGTTLAISASGTYGGESTWSGGGGGYSRFEAEAAYQRSVQTTGVQTAPDVAFDANPYTGVSVYTTAPSTGQGTWETVGGTSLGAPAWAAIVAIADQGRAAAGLGTLDGATQTLPSLYSLPSSDFHKVSSLTTTGLGSPNGSALVNGLAFGASTTTTTGTGSGTGTGASGGSQTGGGVASNPTGGQSGSTGNPGSGSGYGYGYGYRYGYGYGRRGWLWSRYSAGWATTSSPQGSTGIPGRNPFALAVRDAAYRELLARALRG